MHNESDPEHDVARALAALPADDARPYDWREFQRRRAHAAPGRRGTGAGALAAAVCAVASVAVLVRLDHHAEVRAVTAAARGTAERPPPREAAAAAGAAAAERWLASLPREPAVVRVGTRADVLGLEDRIAQVDDLLTADDAGRGQDAAVLVLQRERARLVSSLVQVRYAETLANESR
jgi:hypothetical protein